MYLHLPSEEQPPLAKFAPGHFDQLAVIQLMKIRAVERCEDIARAEKMLGYEESWMTYRSLIEELNAGYIWLTEILP